MSAPIYHHKICQGTDDWLALNADDASKLMAAYRSKWGEA